jgi:cortactin
MGFDHVENLSKHSSQVDHSKGFGGKFGVAQDRKDQSAVGFDHVESLSKHSSQVDYSKGFGGKYGINSDRKDQSAVGFDHVEKVQKHSSQVDHSKGFGGKFGVEKNMDKSACSFEEDSNHVVGTNYQRTRADSKTDIKDIKSKFENNAFINNDESKKRVEEIRAERMNIVKKEKEEEISRNNEIKKPGKININSAFLNNTQEQPIKQQPQITKPNKINFNRFNLNNNNNNNNQKEEEPIKQEIIKPISVPDVDVIEYPQQMPSAPEEVKQPESAVNFNPPIGFNQTEDSNVDEWNDDDSPPKIIPTHAAKIEDQYQQEDIYENMDDDSYIQMPQPQVTKTQQPSTVGNSSSHGNKAIALYDFVASEPDELSFDPNDIIENIQIVNLFFSL